eukprot:TRINITY_DN91149_c0_g1_i1.p1 TRINITY_DN91149_c0_g1~~TRINITY_DN91149_c0_g1_i1.p1  ORF type:complete len:979 (+),score=240.35 TRINITY_DN91149_c0_g1_i1:101-3037(+)
MSLRALGLCGVDESVDVELLRLLSSRYPQVEFGVLFREDKEGSPRYPSPAWVEELASQAAACMPPMLLAAHLCGKRCGELLNTGKTDYVMKRIVELGFGRIQVNATKINGVEIPDMKVAAQNLRQVVDKITDVEWIIQANDETKVLYEEFLNDPSPAYNVSILFDSSCGTGTEMTAIQPLPANGLRCGYAGGIGPANVRSMLQKLRAGAAKGKTIWIDMEGKLRGNLDGKEVFDFTKAQAVCKAVHEEGFEQAMDIEALTKAELPANTLVSGHPLLAHKMTKLRDVRTAPRDFRQLLRELTFHVGYEATAELQTAPRSDVISPKGPVCGSQAVRLSESIALVPILRAGLGMTEAMLELLPNAVVHHIGMFRTHGKNAKPIEYYSRLPKDSVSDVAFILDPMIATGRTVQAAISKLKGWGAKKIAVLCICASLKGVQDLKEMYPDVKIYAVQVDKILRSDGYILPGLGDAGDRQYGTPAGDPLSKGTYDSFLAPDGSRRSPLKSPASPPSKMGLPEHSPVTKVLGKRADYMNPDAIPPVDLGDDRAMALTTHDGSYGVAPAKLWWGAASPEERGPVLCTSRHVTQRNAIGAHAGGYSIYRALAVVSNNVDQEHLPKLGMTTPVATIGPFPAWHDPKKIVTLDPYGHAISEGFGPWLEKGYDIRPTIAVTKAHIELPECREALRVGRLVADGKVLMEDGQSFVTKAAIEPVWYLPGIASRFGVSEDELRQAMFKETNSMYPELLTRRDLKLFLPPIGGLTVYIWGDPSKIPDESVELTCRVHDECNGSDVFGSDICTCRPYLTHAIEECIKTAQRGGTGVVVYFRKEGRALGEVTKYLVYNMRKRQEGGDRATEYFNCTKEVAGVTDTRFQVLMPDVLHWLGITKIHRFISMSDMKHDAIVSTGIKIEERVEIPPDMVPKDAHVEIAAKVFAGYHAGKSFEKALDSSTLDSVKGREYTKAVDYKTSVQEGGKSEGTAMGK